MLVPEGEKPTIRAYQETDRAALYDICVRTAADGQDARGLYSSDEMMPDVYAGPYAQLEPGLAFVLADPRADPPRVVGYVVGTSDTENFVRAYRSTWIPLLDGKYPVPPDPPRTLEDWLLSSHYRPERMLLAELRDYPAHLHIDLLPDYQGQGYGTALIETFFAAAAEAGADGVHVSVAPANVRAPRFYARFGFHEIPAGNDSVLYLGRAL